MRKITALVAGSIGYVLGARAGRERYDQIVNAVTRAKSNPTVQQTAHQVAEAAKEAAPVVKEKVSNAAGAAAAKVSSSSSDDGGTSSAAAGDTEVPMESSAYPINDADAKNV